MGDALLAAYLLGLAHVREETGRVELAEGDPPPKMTAGPLKLRFNVPPEEALKYFRSKKIVTKKEFGDLRHDAQSAAFTVGGIYRQDVLTAFRDELAVALENGTPQATVIKRFKGILDGAGHRMLGDFHLETIFRTNMQMAYGVGRRRGLEDVADDLPYWEYHAVLDDRTRPAHAALDGLIKPANDPFWDEHYPPWGFNCFLPGTKIQGRFQLGFRSWYDGKAVEITTRSGNRVRVTANHPILTAEGFVAAQSLGQGNYVLSYLGGRKPGLQADRRGKSSIRVARAKQSNVFAPQENINDSPLTVEQVFRALVNVGNLARFPVTPNDFHRDAMFGNGYVEVVAPNGKLRNSIQPDGLDGSQNNILKAVNAAFAEEMGLSAFGLGVKSILAAAPRLPSRAALPGDSHRDVLESSPFNLLLVGWASQLEARRTQGAGDNGAREAEFAAELQNGYSTLIAADEIIQIRHFDFCGHVFDFQTEGGWIVAEGIFASNCRCSVSATATPPDSFTPANPSGHYQLAYNDDGVPVAASDGMQVHNLSGGKFKGVPRQAGLRETIEAAAERARQSRSTKAEPGSDAEYLEELQRLTKPDRNYKPPARIIESAREFQRAQPTEEVMHIFDAKGRFVRAVRGDAEGVKTPDKDVPKVNGGSTIHWHPPEGDFNFESFSLDDIIQSVEENEAETFVATRRYLYSLRPPQGRWTMELLRNIIGDHERYSRQFETDMRPRLLRSALTLDKAEDLGRHLIWKKIAKKYGMRYKQIRL